MYAGLAVLVAATALPVESAEAQPAGAGTHHIVNLKASNGQFVVSEWGGGREVKADRNAAVDWERFVAVDLNGGNLVSGGPHREAGVRRSSGDERRRAMIDLVRRAPR